jgi:hypothetical protein
VNRLSKFLIFIAVIWILGILPIYILIPFPHFAPRNVEGAIAGIIFVAAVIGGLIWVLWLPKNSN